MLFCLDVKKVRIHCIESRSDKGKDNDENEELVNSNKTKLMRSYSSFSETESAFPDIPTCAICWGQYLEGEGEIKFYVLQT